MSTSTAQHIDLTLDERIDAAGGHPLRSTATEWLLPNGARFTRSDDSGLIGVTWYDPPKNELTCLVYRQRYAQFVAAGKEKEFHDARRQFYSPGEQTVSASEIRRLAQEAIDAWNRLATFIPPLFGTCDSPRVELIESTPRAMDLHRMASEGQRHIEEIKKYLARF